LNARRLLLALFIALIISGVFTYWLSRRFAHSPVYKPATLQYVATTADLDAGQTLRPADLQRIEWPSNIALVGTFLKPEDVVGRTLLYPLAKGEPVLQRQLSAPGVGVGLSTKIPDGMRAISLKSGEVVGVAGFLLPGTRIDVLVTYHSAGTIDPITSTVLQDAQILAAGQKMQPDPEGKPTAVDVVTLLVTPYDAERVVLASAQGTVHFVLRNGSDHAQIANQPAEMSGLGEVAKGRTVHTAERRVAAAPAAPAPYTVETLRGDKHSVENF
jgi:pilus assembly protein CpaB